VTATRSTTCSPGLINSGDRPDGYERGEADGDFSASGPRIHLLDAEADTSDVDGYP